MQYIQEISLDIFEHGYVSINAKQGDQNGRFIRIHLTSNGVEFKLSDGETVEFRALKPDGKSIDNPATIEDDGTILACLTDQTLAVDGEVIADIAIKQGSNVVSTLNFVIDVQKAPLGEDIPSTNEFGTLTKATEDAVSATNRANDAAGLIEGMTVSASKVAAGGTPTAKLTTDGDHYNLALGLVTGDEGAKGDKGDTPTIEIADTVTGAPGDPAKVENVGTPTDPKLQFTIPKGDKGDAATVRVGTVTTGSPGTMASVTNSGTTTDAVLNFTIPRGAVGATGSQGATGPVGPPGGVNSVNGVQGDVSVTPLSIGALPLTGGTVTGRAIFKGGLCSVSNIYGGADAQAKSGYLRIAQIQIGAHYNDRVIEFKLAGRYPRNHPMTLYVQFTFPLDNADPNLGSFKYDGYDLEAYIVKEKTSTWAIYVKKPAWENIDVLYFLNGHTSYGIIITTTPEDEGYYDTLPVGSVRATPFFDVSMLGTQMHRNIFRGKSLGSTFTAAQKAAIAAGTWDDLYLGDYWTINKHTWRIADFDYWLGKGDTPCTKHHIVVVPDTPLYSAQMHNTGSGAYEAGTTANTTEGGYFNSDMRTKNLTQAKALIETDFGTGSILKHRILLTNAVKDGYPSGGAWCDSEVDLMNEMMVYGAYHFAPRGNGTIIPYNYTTEHTQLALFQVVPYYIVPNRSNYWLRDVISATSFASIPSTGHSSTDYTSRTLGVRPAVGIVGS